VKKLAFFAVLLCAALFMGCTGNATQPTPTPAPTATPAPTPEPTAAPTAAPQATNFSEYLNSPTPLECTASFATTQQGVTIATSNVYRFLNGKQRVASNISVVIGDNQTSATTDIIENALAQERFATSPELRAAYPGCDWLEVDFAQSGLAAPSLAAASNQAGLNYSCVAGNFGEEIFAPQGTKCPFVMPQAS
jgi:hypothetical protein